MNKSRLDRLVTILGGELSIELHLQFLIRNNKSDLLILKQTKDAIRVSVCHTATVIANALMHSGTTSDQFLRCAPCSFFHPQSIFCSHFHDCVPRFVSCKKHLDCNISIR